MSAFQVERPTPQSFAQDLESMIQAGSRVSMREEEIPVPRLPGLPDVEWT